MFKFDFDIEDADDEVVIPQTAAQASAAGSCSNAAAQTSRAPPQPSHSISLADLIKTLPASFSYTPLAHPCGAERAPLLRRDLFDARFQLAQDGHDAEDEVESPDAESTPKAAASEEPKEGAEYVDADTDLVPGTYEGGLKSWEGGLDLVEVLAANVAGEAQGDQDEDKQIANWVRGARVLEVGCGTGLPSAYLLRALLSTPATADQKRTTLHLQDYNLPVLSLVTLPNLVLAALRALPADVLAQATTTDVEVIQEINDDDEDADEYADEAEDKFGDDDEEKGARERRTRGEVDGFDGRRAGTLDLTPELLAAFTKVLEERGVDLQFTYGDWSGMATTLADEVPYSLVLTAETIYAEESQRALLDVLQTSARYTAPLKETARAPASLEASLDSLSVRDDWARQPLSAETPEPVVLVAAKVLYFGVGGGLDSFLAQVAAEKQGWSVRVRDWVKGVGRAVVRVGWQA